MEPGKVYYRTFKVLEYDAEDGTYVMKTRVTAAMETVDDLNTVRVAFAYCSPRDQYDKTKGQLIAYSRISHPGMKRLRNGHTIYSLLPLQSDTPLIPRIREELAQVGKRISWMQKTLENKGVIA